jgi:predicted aspartyl protease
MRNFTVAFVLLSFAAPAAAADRPRPAAPLTPVEIDAHGGIIVDVRVNDAGPYRFLLDTGASRSIISESLAGRLGAPPIARTDVVTSAGTDVRLVVRLGSLAIAAVKVADLLTPVVPDARLEPLGTEIRGIVGQDFLSGFNYTLDYRRSRLTWDDELTCNAPGRVPLVAVEGRFVMALTDAAGAPLRLVPDSGAEVAVLFTGGTPRRTLGPVRVGAVTMKRMNPVLVERTDANADGLLPLHHFATVSFAAGGACMLPRQ